MIMSHFQHHRLLSDSTQYVPGASDKQHMVTSGFLVIAP
jgi:hypothetical protein